jgi:hypothetical protein
MALEETTYISQFNVMPNGTIGVQKTTDITKDGVVVSSSYWRTTLVPNDPQATTVLDEQYYLDIANYAWSQTSPQPYVPPTPPTITETPPVTTEVLETTTE